MRKLTLILIGTIALSMAFISCKKDDSSPSNGFPGVPSGDIVDVAEREATLTRSLESFKSTDAAEYWQYAEAKATVSGCDHNETIDMLDEAGIDPGTTEISFGKDYRLYVKYNGSVTDAGGWHWDDVDTKNGIVLDKYPSVTFTFTALNKNEVVYASKQTGATEECANVTAITYERVTAN